MMRFSLISVVLMAVMLLGCNETEKEEAKAKEEVAVVKEEVKVKEDVKIEQAPDAVKVEDKVMVTINGKEIMLSEVNKRMQPQLDRAKMMGQKPNEGMLNNLRKRVIDGIIQETVITEKIKDKGVVVADEEVTAKLEEIAKQQGRTIEQLIASAAPRGFTEEKIREQIKMNVSFNKLMEIEAGDGAITVTDQEAKKYYDDNIARYSSPDSVKTSHILAGGRGFDSFDEEIKADAKLKIEKVKKKLDAGGNFEELAKEFSDCPSKDKGGDLGVYITIDGKIVGQRGGMDGIFSKAAHKLKVGELTDIVKTPFGYHIIKTTDRKKAEVKSFQEVKDTIVQQQGQTKKNKFASGYIKKLKDDAEVIYADKPETTTEDKTKVKIAPDGE
ncbi:MAG: hypothetical protein FVQ82_05380 [Planctomycetes bacterium]|nr:hypothetical protein [Planctomycetota bacterium]